MTRYISILLYATIIFADTKTITLDECIARTLKNHPNLKQLFLSVQKSQTSLDIAKAAYLPQITLSAQYNPINTFVMPQNGQFKTIRDDNYFVDAVLNQKIYDFSKTKSLIDASKKDVQIASLSLEDLKALLVYNVKILYNTVLLQNSVIEARQSDLKTKEELYTQAKAFTKEGLKTKADEASILSSLFNAKDALAIAKAQKQKALSTLSLYTAQKIEDDTVFDDALSKEAKVSDTNIVDKNIALKTLQEEIDKNSLLYNASKASYYGSIDAIASLSHQNSLNEYDTSMVGIVAKFPLYSGGSISAQIQQNKISKEISKEAYNSKKLSLEEEIDSLLIDIKRYEYTIEAKQALIESSSLAKDIVNARYKEGLSTYIEALDASTTYLNAKLGLLEAEYGINNIINRLEYLRGNI